MEVAKDGMPERLGCGKVKEEVSQILQVLHEKFSFHFILLRSEDKRRL